VAVRLARVLRTGIGYDVHALAPGESLILGGVRIEHNHGLAGHSDGDVLTHAIIDALLGAAALGDIGHHFPSSDPQWEGASSIDLLRRAAALVHDASFSILNVDSTVIAAEPKLAPYTDSMCKHLSEALGIADTAVSVKATTTDGLGITGRREGIAALAIALLD
jgi:2-C-methyl-D-erythritol 2,4-cyclodiphosphate synthase